MRHIFNTNLIINYGRNRVAAFFNIAGFFNYLIVIFLQTMMARGEGQLKSVETLDMTPPLL